MKQIVAIIRPNKLGSIQTALKDVDVHLMTINEVFSYSPAEGHTLIYRSAKVSVPMMPKLKIEITVDDYAEDAVVDAIINAGSTGANGDDGKILVTHLNECVSICTKGRSPIPR